jgi:hypothetical protein
VVGGLVIFMGVALLANTQRSLALFREGTATLGRIHKVNAPADQHGNATVILEVTFTGAQGPCTGQVVMLGKLGEFDAREGLEVPVLFSAAKPKQFAVYASGLGMYVGTVK